MNSNSTGPSAAKTTENPRMPIPDRDRRMIENPVRTCAILGAAAGMIFGIPDVAWECVRYGVDHKVGALIQYGVTAPAFVGFYIFGGMAIGLLVGLGMATIRSIN
jgi:hypothetical protein